MEHLLDTELVDLARGGEDLAFDLLMKRYQKKVTQLVYRYVEDMDTAADLVQDVFLKIFRNLVNFKGDSKFSSWLFRIAVNESIDFHRRQKVRKEQSLDQMAETGYDVRDPREHANSEALMLDEEERIRVREAMAALPEAQRSVVVLKVYQDMTFDEIAEILQEPVSTIKSRLYKALNNLGGHIRRRNFLEGGSR